MISANDLLRQVPVIQNMLNAIEHIKIRAEIKVNDRYEPIPDTNHLNQILIKDGASFLSKMYLSYITYGSALAYKVKTRRAILEASNGNPIYDYGDGAVDGLHVLPRNIWELDEDASTGKINGAYINTREMVVGNRNYLNRREFIYATDWNPTNRPSKSIGSFIDDTLNNREPSETISSVLGIDNDLITESEGESMERHIVLVDRAMHDTIIPSAHRFVTALKHDIGIRGDMRLVLNAGDPDEWVNVWNTVRAASTSDHIVYV